MKKRIYFDMDGVLCDYRKGSSVEDMMKKGYFATLKPRTMTVKAVKKLVKSDMYDVYVLSSVIGECKEQSIREKNEWLDANLPEIDNAHRIFTVCGTRKADAVESISQNDILFDDYSRNLFDWVSAGGKGIKVLNGCNGVNGTYCAGPRLKINNRLTLFRAIAAV